MLQYTDPLEMEGKPQLKEMEANLTSWLGGGFKYFLFSPVPGEMIQFD